jgi:hypothetical protein
MTAPDSQDVTLARRRLGPHYVPRIACGRCGREHHIDAASGEFQGACHDCSGYLRRPTEAEEQQFHDFLEWNMRHADRPPEGPA